MTQGELQATMQARVQQGKGLLAADESGPTLARRFKTIGVESTEENRRVRRSLLLTTPGLGEFVSGVILHQETLGQTTDDGTPLPQRAARQGIVARLVVFSLGGYKPGSVPRFTSRTSSRYAFAQPVSPARSPGTGRLDR